jgi:hypothetical protein
MLNKFGPFSYLSVAAVQMVAAMYPVAMPVNAIATVAIVAMLARELKA